MMKEILHTIYHHYPFWLVMFVVYNQQLELLLTFLLLTVFYHPSPPLLPTITPKILLHLYKIIFIVSCSGFHLFFR